MPLPPDTAEHAYVVEYRALDRCFVPECEIKSKDALGWLNDVQPDGDLGGYARWGNLLTEAFVRRAALLAPGEEYAFNLPEAPQASELDVYLGALEGPWAATLEVHELTVAAPPRKLDSRAWSGTTQGVGLQRAPIVDIASRYFTHVRVPLPERRERKLRVSFRASGSRSLVLGNPLVMKRVERAPRQAVFWIADAIMHPLMRQVLKEGSDDPRTAWLAKAVADQGIYFSFGHSPGMNTSTYVRRFFRDDFFRTEGEPVLAGLGIDETPPRAVPTFVARMAAEGFQTELFVNNIIVMPHSQRMGWDGGYQTELDLHTTSIPKQFEAWVADHPRDDSLSLFWYSNTHGIPGDPARQAGRRPRVPAGLAPQDAMMSKLEWVYAPFLEDIELLLASREAFRKVAPGANRLWYIGSDHGSGFTRGMYPRAGRLVRSGMNTGAAHGIFGSGDESEVPFAVLYDRGRKAHHPASWDAPSSALVVWQALEEAFDIKLGMPPTSTYRVPFFVTSRDPFPEWDDGGMVAWGNAGAIRLLRGGWAYRSANPRLTVTPIWTVDAGHQKVMLGTDNAANGIPAEELYDVAKDRYELHNVAAENLDRLVAMRQRTNDWISAHHDPPSHPRRKYVLALSRPTEISLVAPHAFEAFVDGARVTSKPARAVSVHGTRIEIVEGKDPVGIVEVSGAGAAAPLVLRCAANRLPLQVLSPERPRFDLATAHHNCVLPAPSRSRPRDGEVLFSSEPAPRLDGAAAGALEAGPGGVTTGFGDLQAGMKRWGYVRDMEKKP